MSKRVCLIANPRSAGGRTESRLPLIEAAAAPLFDEVAVWRTERPRHATELAAKAAAEGFDIVVAVGGDGTANEVVNGLFDGDQIRNPELAFSALAAGTGCDLVKSLKVPRDVDAAMRMLAEAKPRPTDVTYVTYTTHDGEPGSHIGINVTGFGMSGATVQRANQSDKRYGGTITFLGATVAALREYTSPQVEMTLTLPDGETATWEGRLNNCFVANGHYCGGGMWVGRGGSMQDGFVDVTVIPDMPAARVILGGVRLFTGTMERVKGVKRFTASALSARCTDGEPILIDVDGEQPGILPINIRVLSKSLNVIGLWS